MPDPLPLFEQPIASTLKLAKGNRADSVAHTFPFTNKVYVDDPAEMTEPIMAHEVFHKIQDAAQSPLSRLTQGSDTKGYDYGGTEGLGKLNSISQLGVEQQAQIPRNYQEEMQHWAQGKITPEILQQADALNSAYRRPVQQLAHMAASGIDTTPAAPGPPPATLTGMIKPLPEIGGNTLYRKQ